MTSPELKAGFCQDVVTLQNLGVRILVVHGGGPQINAMLEKVGVESRFEGGMRVSSKEVVDVAEMACKFCVSHRKLGKKLGSIP